jgi:large subunit ribosomal protein L17
MHRHGYTGRKLQRATGPRRALVRGQLTSLVLHEAITTTEAKAKEVAPRFEQLVTTAKKDTLASARSLRRELLTENATQKMLQELIPAFKDRHGGYTRIIKLENRRGDNAPMARLGLVLDGQSKVTKANVTKDLSRPHQAEADSGRGKTSSAPEGAATIAETKSTDAPEEATT